MGGLPFHLSSSDLISDIALPFCKGSAFRPPFFDGSKKAAERQQVKAVRSTPEGLGLYLMTHKARIPSNKKRGSAGTVYRRRGKYVAMTE